MRSEYITYIKEYNTPTISTAIATKTSKKITGLPRKEEMRLGCGEKDTSY